MSLSINEVSSRVSDLREVYTLRDHTKPGDIQAHWSLIRSGAGYYIINKFNSKTYFLSSGVNNQDKNRRRTYLTTGPHDNGALWDIVDC
jgi:hypothetical protein